jgi:catechol 2,3-dioxygenase-like lactoylglutathione lyase family enzyme
MSPHTLANVSSTEPKRRIRIGYRPNMQVCISVADHRSINPNELLILAGWPALKAFDIHTESAEHLLPEAVQVAMEIALIPMEKQCETFESSSKNYPGFTGNDGKIYLTWDFDKSNTKEVTMQLKFMSVLVDDQEKALQFYTEKLGFAKMADIPMGAFRWLTVTSPEGIEGAELVLEPMSFPPAVSYQKALYEAGIPAIALISRDIQAEFNRLSQRGIVFRGEPKNYGPITSVVFEDTCGNLINLVQPMV